MGLIQTRRWCKTCEEKTLHARGTVSNGWGCLLSLLTLGLFVPVWIGLKVLEAVGGQWRCQACGTGRRT